MLAIEPLLALLIGSILGLGATRAAKLVHDRKLVKYGPILFRVYDIVDPLLERHMRGWTGSDVEFGLELAVKSVSDGKLTDQEIKEIVTEIGKRWLPTVAANKVRAYEKLITKPKELSAAGIIANAVNGRTDARDAIGQVRQILRY